MIKQVRALSSDLLKPKYHVTCILMSNEPRTVRVRYVDVVIRFRGFTIELRWVGCM